MTAEALRALQERLVPFKAGLERQKAMIDNI